MDMTGHGDAQYVVTALERPHNRTESSPLFSYSLTPDHIVYATLPLWFHCACEPWYQTIIVYAVLPLWLHCACDPWHQTILCMQLFHYDSNVHVSPDTQTATLPLWLHCMWTLTPDHIVYAALPLWFHCPWHQTVQLFRWLQCACELIGDLHITVYGGLPWDKLTKHSWVGVITIFSRVSAHLVFWP